MIFDIEYLKNIKGYEKAMDNLVQILFDDFPNVFKGNAKPYLHQVTHVTDGISNEISKKIIDKCNVFMEGKRQERGVS